MCLRLSAAVVPVCHRLKGPWFLFSSPLSSLSPGSSSTPAPLLCCCIGTETGQGRAGRVPMQRQARLGCFLPSLLFPFPYKKSWKLCFPGNDPSHNFPVRQSRHGEVQTQQASAPLFCSCVLAVNGDQSPQQKTSVITATVAVSYRDVLSASCRTDGVAS